MIFISGEDKEVSSEESLSVNVERKEIHARNRSEMHLNKVEKRSTDEAVDEMGDERRTGEFGSRKSCDSGPGSVNAEEVDRTNSTNTTQEACVVRVDTL
jgi:hypothetical protein